MENILVIEKAGNYDPLGVQSNEEGYKKHYNSVTEADVNLITLEDDKDPDIDFSEYDVVLSEIFNPGGKKDILDGVDVDRKGYLTVWDEEELGSNYELPVITKPAKTRDLVELARENLE